jgi:hypothetical protein
MLGLRKSARAMQSRCLWPPDSLVPFIPMSVAKPSGKLWIKSRMLDLQPDMSLFFPALIIKIECSPCLFANMFKFSLQDIFCIFGTKLLCDVSLQRHHEDTSKLSKSWTYTQVESDVTFK